MSIKYTRSNPKIMYIERILNPCNPLRYKINKIYGRYLSVGCHMPPTNGVVSFVLYESLIKTHSIYKHTNWFANFQVLISRSQKGTSPERHEFIYYFGAVYFGMMCVVLRLSLSLCHMNVWQQALRFYYLWVFSNNNVY